MFMLQPDKEKLPSTIFLSNLLLNLNKIVKKYKKVSKLK